MEYNIDNNNPISVQYIIDNKFKPYQLKKIIKYSRLKR
jgi:hypothetical protein